ncbi:hypothetical protein K491DRAFT_668128 [Lophiostoma macrostomum CBS 122681]|uniref:Heterokaryon incompatibility domain-containing protein n=1 Tax=Lophiostoma macrostomum CBS 122681 TaxID=1314788 RepID=A0A6A6STY9_9PLEO|nr:hypothetical protein K491DRAFT_668128 [Lophiostoma macrostomum CBS 122681]
MEHIESPHAPAYPQPKVPVLSTELYDGLGLASFPDRRGFNERRLISGDFTEHPASETAAFLQAWLYFGTLRETLDDFGVPQRFITIDPESEHGVVDTSLLEDSVALRLQALRTQFYSGDPLAWPTYYRIEDCIRKLLIFCSFATVPGDKRAFPAEWPLSPEVDLSLRLLGRCLASSLYPALMFIIPSNTAFFRFPPAYFTIARMQEAGWCPREISMLTETLSPCALHFASRLRRARLDHSSCSTRLCSARQVDTSSYRTGHVVEECSCGFIGPPFDQILTIIRRKQIPLLTIGFDQVKQTVTFDVEAYTGKQVYVAFSHVWSDGLGNPNSNTLPRCQILRLHNLLQNLSSQSSVTHLFNIGHFGTFYRRLKNRSLRFWLDTLCIPPSDQYAAERLIALQKMKDTYEKSYQVLILDRELESSRLFSSTENFMRIAISGWMRRLWTLQEGVLGERLFAKFKDGFFEVHRLNRESPDTLSFEDLKTMIRYTVSPSCEIESIMRNMRYLRAAVISKPERKMFGTRKEITYKNPEDAKRAKEAEGKTNSVAIFEAFKASVYRSSSREDDEFTCMASLLAWDMTGLRDLPLDERMHHLLSKQARLPQELIFIAGPRMQRTGWRWAVNRFGNRTARQLKTELRVSGEGTIGELGFTVTFPGLILPDAFDPSRCHDFVTRVDQEPGQDTVSFFRITRHEEFENTQYHEPIPGTKMEIRPSNVITRQMDRPSSCNHDIDAITHKHEEACFVVVYSTFREGPIQNVPTAAAVLRAPKSALQDRDSDTGIPSSFQYLATLEFLGTVPQGMHTPLGRHDPRLLILEHHARHVTEKWCVQ